MREWGVSLRMDPIPGSCEAAPGRAAGRVPARRTDGPLAGMQLS